MNQEVKIVRGLENDGIINHLMAVRNASIMKSRLTIKVHSERKMIVWLPYSAGWP